ncbi:MAG: DnaD domain protein [Candidatus Pristimantibacillus lignocellulolyticus]|uniref:DnaD domain protein n=1 Tax=Candidatus Pristimantibacillus lignocellulolyticus TaxID=2994561 RepID=A0A9J6ZGA1_9BACL|nr:MAG: DnaD domain protein [Candidatus Pristimantibacillus lignocellulolyticus]
MRIQHLFEFTEHHQYYCYRDFSLSTVDYRMLSLIYKPLVGAFAISLYEQLCMIVPEGKTGYSPIEPHRRLLLGLGLALNDKSRTYLLEQLSKLEAIGLLQSSRFMKEEQDDYIYEYELACPLPPNEFFENIHLTMLLRDKLGKYAVIDIREQMYAPLPEEVSVGQETKVNISVPFYEIFKLNAHIVDDELDQALLEVAPARATGPVIQNASAGYSYSEISIRFPRNSNNRYFVEQLRTHPEQLAQINYVAYKYELAITQVSRLLDEDGVFDISGELDFDQLQRLAVQFFRQDKKHEEARDRKLAQTTMYQDEQTQEHQSNEQHDEPEFDVDEQFFLPVPKLLANYCDINQYNALMRNEPHIQFLKRYFPGSVPDWILNVFERIDLHYKLAPPVINVLIHYGIGMNDSGRVTKAYLDSIASNMLMKGIDSYEKAVQYVRDQDQLEKDIVRRKEDSYQSSSSIGRSNQATANRPTSYGNNRGRSTNRQKPVIPTISNEQVANGQISAEELEELRQLARKFDQQP